MNLDIRLPIGMMFTLFGVILSAFGLLGNQQIYQRSLGVNINFGWGLVMIVFGVFMLILGMRKPAAKPPAPSAK
jgi:multisubunit Na+/H+ antiporter MnhG subunit